MPARTYETIKDRAAVTPFPESGEGPNKYMEKQNAAGYRAKGKRDVNCSHVTLVIITRSPYLLTARQVLADLRPHILVPILPPVEGEVLSVSFFLICFFRLACQFLSFVFSFLELVRFFEHNLEKHNFFRRLIISLDFFLSLS